MSKESRGGDDLSALIRQAEGEVSRQTRQTRPASSGLDLKKLLVPALLSVAAYCTYAVWAQFAPPSPDKVALDLDLAIEAARDSVEKSKSETGQLPEVLPGAALGSVVRYERGTNDYRLSASILGVQVTLERDGRKTTEKGVKP